MARRPMGWALGNVKTTTSATSRMRYSRPTAPPPAPRSRFIVAAGGPAASAARGGAGRGGGRLRGGDAAGDGSHGRERRPIGRPGQRLGRSDRDGGAARAGGRDLADLEGDRAVAAGAAGLDVAGMDPLHGRLRVERVEGVLEL